jgi:hypothetical protein
MSSLNQPGPAAGVLPLRDPVSGVLQRAYLELQQLLEQRREIRRRMKSLRQALRGLQQGVGAGSTEIAEAGPSQPPQPTPHDPSRNSRFDHPPRGRSRLQRACRIALLEAGGTASPEEIYMRILRRGSFSFRYRESPVAAIARVLTTLDAGEVSTKV